MSLLSERGGGGGGGGGFDAAVDLAFEVFDSDGSGTLPLETLASLLRKGYPDLGAGEIEAFCSSADASKDGKVSKAEFREFCGKHRGHSTTMRDALFGRFLDENKGSIHSKT